MHGGEYTREDAARFRDRRVDANRSRRGPDLRQWETRLFHSRPCRVAPMVYREHFIRFRIVIPVYTFQLQLLREQLKLCRTANGVSRDAFYRYRERLIRFRDLQQRKAFPLYR